MSEEQELELVRKHNEWMALDFPSQPLDDAHVTVWLRSPGSPVERYMALQVEHAIQARTPDCLAFDSAWGAWEKFDELKAERVNVNSWPIESKQSKSERASELERIDAEIVALIGGEPVPTQTAVAPEPVPEVAVGTPASVKKSPEDRGWVMKRAALIKKHAYHWPTIERDFQDASENGLSKAAKATGHGDWFEADALNWARQRGKLDDATEQPVPSQATYCSALTHRIRH